MEIRNGAVAKSYMRKDFLILVYIYEEMRKYSTIYEEAVTLLDGTNVRLNWNIESDLNVYWIKFKNCLSLY
jgi:hypothetical protein